MVTSCGRAFLAAIVSTLGAALMIAPPAAAGAPRWSAPPVAGVVDYQLGGAYRPARDVDVVDRDRTSRPARGRYNICYVNAFQTQPDEAAFWHHHHRGLLLRRNGHYLRDPGWPGEYLLDTSTRRNRHHLLGIVGRWIDGCANRGFDAVEPDNLDSWTRHGVRGALTRADNLAFAAALIRRAHGDGLAIAQKNTVGIASRGRALGFDFAIAEECQVYRECVGYTRPYGRHVIEIEYTDNPRRYYRQACAARGGEISILLRDRDVRPPRSAAYRYAHC